MSMGRIRLVALLALLVVVFITAFQNSETVGLSLLFWHFQVNKLVLILGLFLLGAIAGVIASWVTAHRRARAHSDG